MSEITLTDMRKDLFRLVDEMVETGRPLRVRRGSKVIEVVTRVLADDGRVPTPQERWAKFLKKPEREFSGSADFEVLEYGAHWEWRVPKDLT